MYVYPFYDTFFEEGKTMEGFLNLEGVFVTTSFLSTVSLWVVSEFDLAISSQSSPLGIKSKYL